MMVLQCLALLLWLAVADANMMATRSWARRMDKDYSHSPQVKSCKEMWFTNNVDHFSGVTPPLGITTFQQRYFVCDEYWNPNNGTVFFYPGNEADVTLFVSNTGLMWENAKEFSAMLIFVEHRYYGRTWPFGSQTYEHTQYCVVEQAMADYAVFLTKQLPVLGAVGRPVISFGGSYGGMLTAWLRIKYPHLIQGGIAASAPVISFQGTTPWTFDVYGFYKIVSWDFNTTGGCSAQCATNIHKVFDLMINKYGNSQSGRDFIARTMKLCQKLNNTNDVVSAAYYVQGAMSYMAMGNYPFPSSYMLDWPGTLPSWPTRVACQNFSAVYSTDEELFNNFVNIYDLFYNSTKNLTCYNIAAPQSNQSNTEGILWGFQSCFEVIQAMATNGVTDVYWYNPWDQAANTQGCVQNGITPRYTWLYDNFGGPEMAKTASNLVFSNGNLDPWHYGGFLSNFTDNKDLIAVFIPDGAHHVDLYFSTPYDTPTIREARRIEVGYIHKWVDEYNLSHKQH